MQREIEGIDILRNLKPSYTVGCHGAPLTTAQEGYDVATAHRDLYAFIYNQSIRAINKGLTPDELVATIRIPEHLERHPWLFPGYIDHEYAIRAQYRGIVGWYAEDTADLHPPAPTDLGKAIVDGFGGEDAVVERARAAFADKQYNLTAKLLSFVLDADPTHDAARLLKADVLRAMAYSTRSGMQTRNFLLTHALHLDGSIDWFAKPPLSFFGEPTAEAVLAAPPDTYVKILETTIDPHASASVQRTASITFSDLDRSWTLYIRRGVAEVTDGSTDDVDVAIGLPSTTWA